ncbi:High-affinity nicotinic acid transporter [Apiospora rasikravindrae]|uniref:High-affinity nicotinic acid transporter n=1 Tax=Apiospora rasikravindrae TaxID=990691 RepID=A0ABR1RS48_9PEZI
MANTLHGNTETYPDDKADAKTVEHAAGLDPYSFLSAEDADFMRSYEGKRAKTVVRKIDLRLIPIMALLYLCSHIDRGNIGNAKIEGMDKDLGLTGNQYNIASTIFFIPYIIFEIPSNIVLKKLRPSIWLSALVISWGIVMTLMGVVQNFQGMVACRAGFFPGAVFIVSSWYPRHELQQRLALFYTASAFSGALSGLLAFAIAGLDGARGVRGWRWIFLIEGAVTVGIGLCMPFLLVDTPERASWLTDGEKRFVDLRLRLSGVRTTSHAAEQEVDKFSWHLLGRTMVDWKIWCGIVLAWANSVPNAAFKFTMPQIIAQLGFTASKAQLLTIPPYFCGGVSAWLVGRYSDRLAWRFPFIAGPLSVLMAALAVLFAFSPDVKNNVAVMYFGVVLAQIGIYPLLPGISAWVGNNLAPSSKRSIGLAWLLAAGNLGSLVGTNIFLDREGPRYPTGYGTALGIICLAMVMAGILEFLLWKLNKAKAAQSEVEICTKYTQEQLDGMGEKSPLYQYTL